MKLDSQELQHVASAQAPRLDLYVVIHKALRACMADALLAVGRMDADDPADTEQACARVQALLDFCTAHLAHENHFIHRAMEARSPGSSTQIGHEHEAHGQAIAALRLAVQAVAEAVPAQRAATGLALYRQLACFVAHNFEHMNVEETAHNAVLWACYSDAELAVLHAELVGSIPPQEMMATLRWMLPWMSPAERAGMLGEMRDQAPAPVFEAVLDHVQPHLRMADWHKLCVALGRPTVPGLVQG